MIGPLVKDGIYLGEGFESDRHFILFGSAQMKKADLPTRFPKFNFCFLKQVHGAHVVPGSATSLLEADGQFTKTPGQALVIQTADCVPILMGRQNEVCALHAGWRSTALGIVAETQKHLEGPPDWAVLGPHIQFSSFEVGRDVADQLLKSAPPDIAKNSLLRDHNNPEKCFFNLAELISRQLRHIYPQIKIQTSPANTLTDKRFHSYRRDKPDQGRQFSFVVLKD